MSLCDAAGRRIGAGGKSVGVDGGGGLRPSDVTGEAAKAAIRETWQLQARAMMTEVAMVNQGHAQAMRRMWGCRIWKEINSK